MAAVVGVAETDDAQGWSEALARGVQAAGTIGAVPSLHVVTPGESPLPAADETAVRRLADPWGSDPLSIGVARQLHGYLTGNAAELVQQVTDALEPDTCVLVGHGFGSVVAFDVLRRARPSGIRALVTIGSPLGLAGVLRALNVPEPLTPPGDVRWTNVLDPGDVRTGGEGLADLGPGITDEYVDNGAAPAAAEAYLAQGVAARAILSAISG